MRRRLAPQEPAADPQAAGRVDPTPVRAASVPRAWLLLAACAAAFTALDQLTKQVVSHSLARGDRVSVFFGVHITNVRNSGVAFGVFAGHGATVTALTLAAVALVLGYFAIRARTPYLWLPVGVIVGGALGNLIDRAREGAVTDFVDLGFWPTFNLADAGIVIGILGLFYVADAARGRST